MMLSIQQYGEELMKEEQNLLKATNELKNHSKLSNGSRDFRNHEVSIYHSLSPRTIPQAEAEENIGVVGH